MALSLGSSSCSLELIGVQSIVRLAVRSCAMAALPRTVLRTSRASFAILGLQLGFGPAPRDRAFRHIITCGQTVERRAGVAL